MTSARQVLQKLLPPGTLSESSLNEVIKAAQVVDADKNESAVAAFMLNQRGFNTLAFYGRPDGNKPNACDIRRII